MKLIPPDRYPNLIQLINRTYTDEVEQILSAGADENGTIICLAQDGRKQLAIEIGDDDVQIRRFNPTAQFSQQQDTPDRIATNLQKLGDPIVGGWLRQIEQMLATSDDLETAREALFQLYPDLDSTDLAEQMTDAAAAASMAGFWEAGTEMADNEAEFAKIPEGTTRRRDGVDYVLRDSRWHKTEVQSEAPKKHPSTSEIPQSMS
jgi:hypothetical protein